MLCRVLAFRISIRGRIFSRPNVVTLQMYVYKTDILVIFIPVLPLGNYHWVITIMHPQMLLIIARVYVGAFPFNYTIFLKLFFSIAYYIYLVRCRSYYYLSLKNRHSNYSNLTTIQCWKTIFMPSFSQLIVDPLKCGDYSRCAILPSIHTYNITVFFFIITYQLLHEMCWLMPWLYTHFEIHSL